MRVCLFIIIVIIKKLGQIVTGLRYRISFFYLNSNSIFRVNSYRPKIEGKNLPGLRRIKVNKTTIKIKDEI